MKHKTLSELFELQYNGYPDMCKKYPKAAKKRRIQNKWRKRFRTFADLIHNGPGLVDLVKTDKEST